jgi:hypothetical protein
MHTEKVTFPGSGGTPLAGRLDLPDAQPRAVRAVCALLHVQQGRAGRVEDRERADGLCCVGRSGGMVERSAGGESDGEDQLIERLQ